MTHKKPGRFTIGFTEHLEGPPDRRSSEIYNEATELVVLADRLGMTHAWFSEHHTHAHEGHLPTPLLFALHLAGRTQRIGLGSAIVCLNLHHPLDVAEQIAVADTLTGGRLAPGFGSGSTPEEFSLFGLNVTEESERHARFEEALRLIRHAWGGEWDGPPSKYFHVPSTRILPTPPKDLSKRCWVAVNSAGSARIAGLFGYNVLFSHLRTPEQYRQYSDAYHKGGGKGLIAANRPVFVGQDDETAFKVCGPALRTLWLRFRTEGKIPATTPEPTRIEDLCAHPINFVVGGPEKVARELLELHAEVPFDVANVEVRWAGLSHATVCESVRLLMEAVVPLLEKNPSSGPVSSVQVVGERSPR